MKFELPTLPFPKDSLNPVISPETLDYHYGKHHAAYVNNLNNLIPGTQFENMKLEDIIKKSEGGIFNNAAQTYNHTFFWNCLSPNSGGTPSGDIADAINKYFGSFKDFKEKFSKAAVTLFGSGWAWLAKNSDGSLEILQLSNAGTPLTLDKKPIITLDVWEHAYYIDYRNARPTFVEKFWEIVNWDFANKQL
ncbi:MAG: superoxide dismutase [Fe] [Ignavibacteriae bacterium]|nr:superoxide dismutase [Fe] [Ignavibacteriota bacterium]